MKSIASLLFISSFLICGFVCNDPLKALPLGEYYKLHTGEPRIIGGIPAQPGQFPWQVLLLGNVSAISTVVCGGSIISETKILTAAHCVSYPNVQYQVLLGGLTSAENEIGRVVQYSTNYRAHPNFNGETLENDVGVIELDTPLNFTTNIQPINLPAPGEVIGEGAAVRVSGWGITADGSQVISPVLNWVNLTTITNNACQIHFGDMIKSSTLCAIGNPYHSTCSGDSGGALVKLDGNGTATHVGIVSFVSVLGCSAGIPSGYVRTESMLNFINNGNGILISNVLLIAVVLLKLFLR